MHNRVDRASLMSYTHAITTLTNELVGIVTTTRLASFVAVLARSFRDRQVVNSRTASRLLRHVSAF